MFNELFLGSRLILHESFVEIHQFSSFLQKQADKQASERTSRPWWREWSVSSLSVAPTQA